MANRAFYEWQYLGARRVMIAGSFQPNGANTAVLGVKGNGFTVTHTPGGNLYTVQLQDAWYDYDSITFDAQGGTALWPQLNGEPDVKNAQQLVIAVYNGGGSAVNDLAYNAQQRIHFKAILKNTSGNF